jgi:hypothetical protein
MRGADELMPAAEVSMLEPQVEEMPDWMRGADEVMPAAEVSVPELQVEEMPDWMRGADELMPTAEVSVPEPQVEEMPDWMRGADELMPAAEVSMLEPQVEEMPDWMKPAAEPLHDVSAPVAEPVAPAAPAEEMPDWLEAMAHLTPQDMAPPVESPEPRATEQPSTLSWLSGTGRKEAEAAPELPLAAPPEQESAAPVSEEPDLAAPVPPVPRRIVTRHFEVDDSRAMPAWLDDIMSGREDAITDVEEAAKPSEPQVMPDDWLDQLLTPEAGPAAEEMAPAVPGMAEDRPGPAGVSAPYQPEEQDPVGLTDLETWDAAARRAAS